MTHTGWSEVEVFEAFCLSIIPDLHFAFLGHLALVSLILAGETIGKA